MVVGSIVFIVLVLIQFIVINKGSERVSEVTARFTLDAMPGKQMAIDADLNTGAITDAEAKERREKIQRESSFFGAMDLVAGVQKVVVLMEHSAKDGTPKIVEQCSLPLTGKNVVHRVITDLGVMDITQEGVKLVELAKDVSFEDIQKVTGVALIR
jgi:acyl CoA:acetate/3-ketoacid CoA transferase beta subunit